MNDLVTENAELEQLLTRKEAELTRAEEIIRREQQQMRQLEHTHANVRGSSGIFSTCSPVVSSVSSIHSDKEAK